MSIDNKDDELAIELRRACAELNRRLRAGEAARAETWLESNPTLAASPQHALELVYTEFAVREELGEPVAPEQWIARFPQWQDRLERLFQVHACFDENTVPSGRSVGESSQVTSGRRIAHYELLEELGRGGMGVVYRARDGNLNRFVALKLILAGAYAAPAERARFRAEIETVAQLAHPNIAAVFDAGESDAGPYLAMELVEGESLAQRLSAGRLTSREAAQLIEVLGRAIHHAHQRGVVHRDLKPANVLFTMDGVPKIADFGLAKQLDQDRGQTRSGSVLGSLDYMAPEQAAGRSDSIGPATDIYALGAMLYELIAGRPPFGSETSWQAVSRILTEEPLAPSRLEPRVPRDLEVICLKCLRKEPHKRYPDAESLAEDLHCFQTGKPIPARPIGRWERTVMWARRRPAVAGLTALSALAIVCLLVGSLWYNARLQRALNETARLQVETQRQAGTLAERLEYSRRSVYALQLAQVETVWERDPLRGLELLQDAERCPADLRDFTWGHLHRLCQRNRRILRDFSASVLSIAFSPDGRTLATSIGEPRPPEEPGQVLLWDAASGKALAELKGHRGPVAALAFSKDGAKLTTASGKRFEKTSRAEVKIWDTSTWKEASAFEVPTAWVTSVAFAPSGEILATAGGDKRIRLWQVATGEELDHFDGHTDNVTQIAFADSGQMLASASQDHTVRLWDVASHEVTSVLLGHQVPATCVAIAPGGQRLASGGADGRVILWDVVDSKPQRILSGHANRVASVAFSADGKTLVSGGDDFTVRLWDTASGEEQAAIKAHEKGVTSVAFAPHEPVFASAGLDHTVKLWSAAPLARGTTLDGHAAKVVSLAFSPSGDVLATGSIDQTARLWNAASGQLLATLSGHRGAVRGVAFTPDGKSIATAGEDHAVKLWNAATHAQQTTFTAHDHIISGIVFSPDGHWLVTCSLDETVRVWNAASGTLVKTLREFAGHANAVSFSRDGRVLATAADDGRVRLWNTADWSPAATLSAGSEGVNCVCFAPDGQTLASGDVSGTVRLWDLRRNVERARLTGHTHYVRSLAFSPDGKTLASGSGDRWINAPSEVKLWDAVTGQLRATFPEQSAPVAFSTDSRTLATSGLSGTVLLLRSMSRSSISEAHTVMRLRSSD